MKKRLYLLLILALGGTLHAQVLDSVSYDAEYEEQRALERARAEADRLARDEARQQRQSLMGRALRFEFVTPVGFSTNTYISRSGNPYHNHAWDAGFGLVAKYPIHRRWDIQAGLGYRFHWYHFSNSVEFNTTTHLIAGYTPTSWRQYSSQLYTHGLFMPLRIAFVTNRKTDIYLAFNLSYSVGNAFSYSRLVDDNTRENDPNLDLSNIEAPNKFRAEVAVGMSWPLWWIFSGGWEIYYTLTPTFNTSIDGTPSIREFGFRLTL